MRLFEIVLECKDEFSSSTTWTCLTNYWIGSSLPYHKPASSVQWRTKKSVNQTCAVVFAVCRDTRRTFVQLFLSRAASSRQINTYSPTQLRYSICFLASVRGNRRTQKPRKKNGSFNLPKMPKNSKLENARVTGRPTCHRTSLRGQTHMGPRPALPRAIKSPPKTPPQ